jgi:hypothetical protein
VTHGREGSTSAPVDAETVARRSARDEAKRHIQEHSLGEAARISRLSRIREFVLGAQDGLLVRSASSPAWPPPTQHVR